MVMEYTAPRRVARSDACVRAARLRAMVPSDALAAWCAIPDTIAEVVRDLDDQALDRHNQKTGMSIRELAHHLVEAQIVAASIVIAGLGMPGSTYDWSWMLPFGPWMQRLPYRTMPLAASLEASRALSAWVATVAGGLDDALLREVQLRDAPDAALRRVTVADVLRQEVDHVREHVADIQETLQGDASP